MLSEKNCIFCNIINNNKSQPIYEDELIIVIADINPKARVHLLFIPKLHIASLNELKSEHTALIAHLTIKLGEVAKTLGLSNGFRTIINTGKEGGQMIGHLHYHLLGGEQLPGF